MVRVLDKALDKKGLTRAESHLLQRLICEAAANLIVSTGDDSLKEIYNKHSDTDFDAEEADAVDEMKAALEEMFEVELGESGDLKSPEEIMAQLHAQMEKEQQQNSEETDKRHAHKKNAKQKTREDKRKAEADQTSLSIREVYRKLVSALHPDREPDPEERERKTALMQRVNQAYDKKNLLQLLELQLELEHINAHSIAGLSEARLKHFNKILQEQLTELKMEIEDVTMSMHMQLNVSPYQTLQPGEVVPYFLREIAALRRDIRELRKDLEVTKDLTIFKRWLKARQRELKAREEEMHDDDFPFY